MIIIDVKEAAETLKKATKALSEYEFNKATSRALNESIMQGRTEC